MVRMLIKIQVMVLSKACITTIYNPTDALLIKQLLATDTVLHTATTHFSCDDGRKYFHRKIPV